MTDALSPAALDQLFNTARSHNAFTGEVSDETLRKLYDLLKWGPTAVNATPARFVFIKSKAAKEKLRPALAEGNVEKTMSAPVTAIVAYDLDFVAKLGYLFPHRDVSGYFSPNPEERREFGLRNGSLQAAYLILAARSLGLDCGPMSGFDQAKVDAAFFAGTHIKSNILVNLGVGVEASLFPRSPRLPFDEAARIE